MYVLNECLTYGGSRIKDNADEKKLTKTPFDEEQQEIVAATFNALRGLNTPWFKVQLTSINGKDAELKFEEILNECEKLSSKLNP